MSAAQNIKCLLLDDELPGLTYLRSLCESIPGVEVVKAFNDPLKLLEESKSTEFDLCILDIEMPGLNGLEVARCLNKKPVVFVTAYKEYAADAFDLDAIDYIKKPIQKERLEKAIQKAVLLLNDKQRKREYLQLNTNKGKAILFFDTIAWITIGETDKRDKLAQLTDGKEIVLKNISYEQLLDLLPGTAFCRISKKDIVALNRVRYYSHQHVEITVSEKQTISLALSETYRDEFLQKVKR